MREWGDILKMPLTMNGNIVFVYLTKLVKKHLHCLTKSDVRSEVAIGSCNLSRYGVPQEYLPDRKANLLSELMRGVC